MYGSTLFYTQWHKSTSSAYNRRNKSSRWILERAVWLVAGLWSGVARPAAESCPTPAWTRAACRSGRSRRPPSKSAGSRQERIFSRCTMKVWRHRKIWQKQCFGSVIISFWSGSDPWIRKTEIRNRVRNSETDSDPDAGGQLSRIRFLTGHFCDHGQKYH